MRTFLLLFGALAAVQAQAPIWPPPGLTCPERTLALYKETGTPDQMKPLTQQHLAFVTAMLQSGKVLSVGPFADHESAAVIYASTDWDQIQEMMKDDPFLKAGLMKATQHYVWTACVLASPSPANPR